MSNLIITNSCNQNCPFCFASESKVNNEDETYCGHMSVEEFSKLIRYDSVMTSICGGEPTIHPDFCAIMEELFSIRLKRATLLTNGLWPEKICSYFSSLAFEKLKRITFLFNVLETSLYSSQKLNKLYNALGSINPDFAILGFTIYKYPYDYSHIIDLAQKFGIKKIRYSIAAPNITDKKSWNIDPNKDFKKLAGLVYKFILEAKSMGLEVYADCGFLPPCAYKKDELAELMLTSPSAVSFSCPISPIDIASNGETWRCYGLYSVLRANIRDFPNINELSDYYNGRAKLLADIQLFENCKTCEHYWSGLCHGGCLAFHAIKALESNENYCLYPIDDNQNILECIPYIEQKKINSWEANGELNIYIRKSPSAPIQTIKANEVLIKVLDLCKKNISIKMIIDELLYNFENYDEARSNILNIIKDLFNKEVLYFKR